MTNGSPHAMGHSGAETDNSAGVGSSIDLNPSTERVRLHRARRRYGLIPVTVELYNKEVTDLVTHGLLPAEQRADRTAIGKALGRLLDRAFPALREGRLKGAQAIPVWPRP